MWTRPLLTLLGACPLALPALGQEPPPAPPVDPAPFVELGLDAALAEAGRQRKAVLIDFYTDWCEPCRRMDTSTWRHPDVRAWLAAETVPIKIHGEHDWRTTQRFEVRGYPTLLILRADGTQLGRKEGYVDELALLDFGNYALYDKSTVQRARDARDANPADLDLRVTYARRLVEANDQAGALAELLWCWDEAGVRTPYLLGEIQRLGPRHPPALAALRERARKAEEALFAGRGSLELARDLALLNEHAGDAERTLATWTRMREQGLDAGWVDALFPAVFELLLRERRYAELVEGAGDVQARVDRLVQDYGVNAQALSGDGAPDEELLAYLREQVVEDGAKYYEAALGSARPELADSIAARLTSFEASGRTYAALIEHALRAEAPEAARAQMERGIADLPADQHFAIRRAAKALEPRGSSGAK